MILDCLSHASCYYALHPGFRRAFEFLSRDNLAELPPGRHEVDGDRLFALVNRDEGRGREGASLEAHSKYIDIQFLIAGNEEIGWRPTNECRHVAEPYDPARDVMFFTDAPRAWITMAPQQYMIFFPGDAHAPLAARGESLKAVMKVAV